MPLTKEQKEKVYLYYSGPTDDTGSRLVEALGITGGTALPNKAMEIVIGYGAKTDKNIVVNAVKVINHPNSIRVNRNKVGALKKIADAGVNVAKFCLAGEVLQSLDNPKSGITLPLVGRTKFHQGGKGLWTCLTRSQVKKAQTDGAEYFQNYVDMANEYRVHVINGEAVLVQKKTEQEDAPAAFAAAHAEKITNLADKNKVQLDKNTMDYVLHNIGKKVCPFPNQLVKSNDKGWVFKKVEDQNAPANLKETAIAAANAIGLQFSAVDCAVSEDGTVWVIETNSGPGLKKTAFDIYVSKFQKIIEDHFKAKEEAAKAAAKAKEEVDKPFIVKKVGVKAAPKNIEDVNEIMADDEEMGLEEIGALIIKFGKGAKTAAQKKALKEIAANILQG